MRKEYLRKGDPDLIDLRNRISEAKVLPPQNKLRMSVEAWEREFKGTSTYLLGSVK